MAVTLKNIYFLQNAAVADKLVADAFVYSAVKPEYI